MSQHVVTLRNAILEARAALTGATALTDLVPERNITFGNSPQKDRMPRIVIEVSSAEYEATFTQSRKVQTFTVEYAVYSKSVDTCTAIMDEVRQALDTYQSSDFAVRVTDESFQAEVDNVLLGVVVATFQDAAGIPGFDTSAAETLAAVQEDLAQAQTDLAAAQASEQALQDQLDAINNPPAFNATGQPGEGAGALWSTRRIADGYTGPLLQVGIAAAGASDFTNLTDISEEDYVNYYVESVYATQANTQDGNFWAVTRVYDQIGSNDLVYDWQGDGATTLTTSVPRLAFDCGSYQVCNAQVRQGFKTVNTVRYDEMTCIVEAAQLSQTRKVSFGGADHPDGQPYDYFALQAWNSNTNHGLYRVMAGNGTSFSDISVSGALLEPSYPGSVDIRRGMGLSRTGSTATAHTGVNSFKKTDVLSAPANATCKVGWSTDGYNDASSTGDMFYGAVYYEGVFKDTADLTEATEAFSEAVGFRQQRQLLNNS